MEGSIPAVGTFSSESRVVGREASFQIGVLTRLCWSASVSLRQGALWLANTNGTAECRSRRHCDEIPRFRTTSCGDSERISSSCRARWG